jgi:AcrR family transcriptional regulator
VTGGRALQARSVDARRRIVDAAVEVLLEHGYAGASTVRIQQRAGVSRGRLLHHFASRDALVVAAAHHLALERIGVLPLDETWPTDLAERIDAVVDTVAATFEQDYFWAVTELWIAARTNPALRSALLAGEQDLARRIRSGMKVLFGPDLAAHPSYEQVTAVIFTSLRGMALTRSFDVRNGPTDRHVDAVKFLARAVLL